MAYDFEFWAFTTVQIKNKHSGRYFAFKLNRPQRKLLAKLMEDIVAGVPNSPYYWQSKTMGRKYFGAVLFCMDSVINKKRLE